MTALGEIAGPNEQTGHELQAPRANGYARIALLAGLIVRHFEGNAPPRYRPHLNAAFLHFFVAEGATEPDRYASLLSALYTRGYAVLTRSPDYFATAANRNVVLPQLAVCLDQASENIQAAITTDPPLEAAVKLVQADYAVLGGIGKLCNVFMRDSYHDLKGVPDETETFPDYSSRFELLHAVKLG